MREASRRLARAIARGDERSLMILGTLLRAVDKDPESQATARGQRRAPDRSHRD